MREYILFEAKLFLKNKRNLFLFLGTAFFLIGLTFYIPYQNIGDINEKIELEAKSVQNAIAYVPLHEIEENTYEQEYGFYDFLLKEARAIASQEVALTMFDDLDQYVEAGIQVTEERMSAHDTGYGGLPSEFIVPLSQSLRENSEYTYLVENNLSIEENAENGVNALTIAVTWFSSVSFFFLIFLSCEILTEDAEHETIISSYPVDANRKTLGKLMIQTFFTLINIICLFAFGFFLWSVTFGMGTFAYPESIYWQGTYTAVPSYIFISLFFLILVVFIIHMILLSAVLNVMFKNKYLNIFVGGGIYIISYLFSAQIYLLRFTPLNYLNPVGLLNGQLADQFNQVSNDSLTGIIVLGTWSIVYGVLLSAVFARKNRVRLSEKAAGGSEV